MDTTPAYDGLHQHPQNKSLPYLAHAACFAYMMYPETAVLNFIGRTFTTVGWLALHGCWTRDSGLGCRTLGIGSSVRDQGCSTLDYEPGTLDHTCKANDARHGMFDRGVRIFSMLERCLTK